MNTVHFACRVEYLTEKSLSRLLDAMTSVLIVVCADEVIVTVPESVMGLGCLVVAPVLL